MGKNEDKIMSGEKNLSVLLQKMQPKLNNGEYVFCTVNETHTIDNHDIICFFKETEGITIVLEKRKAEQYQLKCDFITAWITLQVHSSLEAVGLTAAFSNILAKNNISCNVIAGYYHDHIFVDVKDAKKAIELLTFNNQNPV